MAKSFSTLVILLIAIAGLFYLGNYLVKNHVFPSLSEYVASTTSQIATDILPISDPDSSLISIQAPAGSIDAFVASTPEALSRGLSGVPSLEKNQGMLFVFPIEGRYDFWMKDMNFPIDIVWIDGQNRVVGIIPNLATSTYPNTFSPPGPIKYVLELNADRADKFGIVVGTIIVF